MEKKKIIVQGFWFLVVVLGVQLSQAGFIRIVPKDDFKVKVDGDLVKIEGLYTVANEGDEAALNVFPKIEIDKWLFVGEPFTLAPKASHTWKVSEEKSKADFFSNSSGIHRGQWAALVERHYTDVNAYPFAVQDLFMVQIGDSFTSQERLVLQAPEVRSQFSISEQSSGGKGSWVLENLSDKSLSVSLRVLAAKEFEVLNLPSEPVVLKSKEKKEGSVRLVNVSARPGSSYYVTLLHTYTDEVNKVFVSGSSSALLGVPLKTSSKVPWQLIGGFGIAALAVFGFFFLKSKKN